MIYEPAEDSYLLQEEVRKFVKPWMKVLDVGTGSGILAETSKRLGGDVLAIDINPEAVNYVKSKGINSVVSDLFSEVDGKFDLIIFNPPYLPKENMEPEDSKLATTGGKKGNEVIERFLKEAKTYLLDGGNILLLFSSLTPDVIELFKKYNYKYEKLSEQKIPFEVLYVYLLE
tara:strand:+ start:417 stop:935 length:519 start_codon:yes stop_codon:yes gene_type:complete